MQNKDSCAVKKRKGLPSVVSWDTERPSGGAWSPQSSQAVVTADLDLVLLLFPPPLQIPRTVLGPVSI